MNEQVNAIQNVELGFNLFTWTAKFMFEGGVFMWVIVAVWGMGAAIGIDRIFRLRRFDIDAPSFMNEIKKFVLSNDVATAIQFCVQSNSLLANVVKSGLKRVNQTRQQIQDMLEASMIESNSQLQKRLSWVGLFANVCTLFGLLGTIQGLILTFGNVGIQDPTEKAKLLAVGISTAMNTTALGLVCSISLLFIHMYLATTAEKIQSDLDEHSMRLIDLLGSRRAIVQDSDDNNKVA